MDLAYVKKVIKLIEKSDVDEIEIEEEGKKIRVAKHSNVQPTYVQAAVQSPVPQYQQSAGSAPMQAPSASPAPGKPEVKYQEVRSPIVGTFYRAPAPDAEPYVEIVQFSWFNPDSVTGDFATEIRFGYLVEKGKRKPFKGGQLVGNYMEALANVRWSAETSFFGDYLGPHTARFNDLKIAGEGA